MFYIIVYIIFLAVIYSEFQKKKPNKSARSFLFIVYVVILGFRGANVGVDTPVYYQHFYFFGQFGCDFVEPGFDWINRICYARGLEAWSLILVCTLITLTPIQLVLHKLPNKEYSIVASLFYTLSFPIIANGMRQAMVCGLFFYLVIWLEYQNNYKSKKVFLIFVVSILTFSNLHATAFVLIPTYFLNRVYLKNKTYLLIFLLSFLLVVVDLSQYLPVLQIGNRDYSRYANNMVTNHGSWLGFSATSILNFVILISMTKCEMFRRYPLVSNLVMLAFITKNLGFNYPIFGRFEMYFQWFAYLIVARMFAENKNLFRNYSIKPWVIIYTLYALVSLNSIFTSGNQLNPYTLYWQNNSYDKYIKE